VENSVLLLDSKLGSLGICSGLLNVEGCEGSVDAADPPAPTTILSHRPDPDDPRPTLDTRFAWSALQAAWVAIDDYSA